MKRIALVAVVVGVILGACAPLNTYYKPGVSVASVNRDETACAVKALRDVPASTQIRRIQPEFVPPVKECNNAGACKIVRAGFFIPGEVITFDPNDGLRKQVAGQCMAAKGYASVSIPPCPDSIARAASAGVTKTFPKLTSKSCVIRNRNGTFQIVTRG